MTIFDGKIIVKLADFSIEDEKLLRNEGIDLERDDSEVTITISFKNLMEASMAIGHLHNLGL